VKVVGNEWGIITYYDNLFFELGSNKQPRKMFRQNKIKWKTWRNVIWKLHEGMTIVTTSNSKCVSSFAKHVLRMEVTQQLLHCLHPEIIPTFLFSINMLQNINCFLQFSKSTFFLSSYWVDLNTIISFQLVGSPSSYLVMLVHVTRIDGQFSVNRKSSQRVSKRLNGSTCIC
jgi:hypothetical protein